MGKDLNWIIKSLLKRSYIRPLFVSLERIWQGELSQFREAKDLPSAILDLSQASLPNISRSPKANFKHLEERLVQSRGRNRIVAFSTFFLNLA